MVSASPPWVWMRNETGKQDVELHLGIAYLSTWLLDGRMYLDCNS